MLIYINTDWDIYVVSQVQAVKLYAYTMAEWADNC